MPASGFWERVAAPYRAGAGGLDKRIHWMVFGSFLAVAARMSVYTFLVIYFVRVVGLDAALVGVAYFAESAARAFFAPFFGALADRVGRRAVILPALVAQTLVLPAFYFVDGGVSLLAWSLALGVAGAAQQPATSALLLDLAPPAGRARALSLQYTAIALGYTVGVAPAGFVAEAGFGFLALVGFVGFGLVVLVYAWGVRGPLPSQPRSSRSFLRSTARAPTDPVFLAFVALAVVFPLGIALMFAVTPLFAVEAGLSPGPVGLLLSVNGIILVVFAIPVAARIERVGPFRWLGFAAVWVAASFLLLGLVREPSLALLLATCVFTVGELFFGATLPVAVESIAPAGERGAYQGAWSMAFGLGFGSALFVASALESRVGWRATWLAFAALFAIAAGLLLVARVYFRRMADERARAARGDVEEVA